MHHLRQWHCHHALSYNCHYLEDLERDTPLAGLALGFLESFALGLIGRFSWQLELRIGQKFDVAHLVQLEHMGNGQDPSSHLG